MNEVEKVEKVEKRSDRRSELQLKGNAVRDPQQNNYRVEVTTRNVSPRGAYLMAERSPSIGDRIWLTLQLTDIGLKAWQLGAVATVLRVDQLPQGTCGFAVKFESKPSLF